MNRSIRLLIAFGLLITAGFGGSALSDEAVDRGLVAVRCDDGSVFLSWRLLAEDPEDMAFRVVRIPAGVTSPEKWLALTGDGPCRGTNFVDKEPGSTEGYAYALYRYDSSGEYSASARLATVAAAPKPYLTIPLGGRYDFQQAAVADLDGDGAYEYIIKQPNFNTDPYQQPGYWKKSTTTYKIEAYQPDGTMMWRHDMGWSIEAGIWYSPWIVYDIDGDGKAEVYCKAGEGDPRDEKGLVQSGPEYLIKLDGVTGKVVGRTEWLSREGYPDYNYYCRNFLAVAYLDGRSPSLIMQRGTYNLIKTAAMDRDFRRIWYWQSPQEQRKYHGQGAHGLISADVDGDGRDELVIGSAVLDDDGKGLWTLEMGHPDVFYVADIDPENPGLEVFYGLETRQETDGICVVDAKSGNKLWAHKKRTRHLHGQGMAGDILAEYPGMEVFVGERDLKERWLYSARGELIEATETGSLTPRALWWDADPHKEVVVSGAVRDWGGEAMLRVQGRVIAVVDCIGDYREEIITAVEGEMRIYTTTVPAADRRVCLMQDRQYRLGVAAQTMGYYYPAQLGR